MRWLLVLVLAATGGCQCAEKVDETGQKAAKEFTGHGTVERGRKAAEKVKASLKQAEDLRGKRADEILEQGKVDRAGRE